MNSTNGVQQYYQAIRDRLRNYIKSDYLANSETLLLYADDLIGELCSEHTNIAREPYICRFAKTYLSYIKFICYLFSPQQKRKAMIKCKSSCKLS